MRELEDILNRVDGRGYPAYKDIQGRRFAFGEFVLVVDHVQGDPYAAPSRLRALVPLDVAALPPSATMSPPRRRATRDFLARTLRRAARSETAIGVEAGEQTVLDRSACVLTKRGLELRFTVDLPASGRKILGREARSLLVERLPGIVAGAGRPDLLDRAALERHCAAVEDQCALRDALGPAGLVAFVADGSVLPRRSGVDDRPLEPAVPFASPPALRVTLRVPNAGGVTGMGIRRGVTLVVGGGFHGKSTLLKALERGVWDHVPGDGREGVVSLSSAVKLRAEDGRAVTGVDISPFVDHLPYGTPTNPFTTDLASGSTSQAAAVMEALEGGASLLLLDEDTSATNFMVRDARMQALVAKEREPITPFVDRIRELHERLGVSTVLVMGGCGDYFDHADTVLQMDGYLPLDVTAAASQVARSHPSGRRSERERDLPRPAQRRLDPRTVRPESRPGRVRVQARGRETLLLGASEVDLRAVEQLQDPAQVRAIGWLLVHLSRCLDETVEPLPLLAAMLDRLAGGDWDWLSARPDGDLALPRLQDAMAALNRLRGVGLAPP